MVAELAGISAATTEQKTSSTSSPEDRISNNFQKESFTSVDLVSKKPPKQQPRWIEVATREPIYDIVVSNETRTVSNVQPRFAEHVIIISAVRNTQLRHSSPLEETSSITQCTEDTIADEVPEEAIYSVVNKVKSPIESSLTATEYHPSRREVLENWLRIASEERSMYAAGMDEDVNTWRRENSNGSPKGIVGLVGPYRVYKNPHQYLTKEYVLQEEELVEEIVDSVSERIAKDCDNEEEFPRTKWSIRNPEVEDEDDDETLVPGDFPDQENVTKGEQKVIGTLIDCNNWELREGVISRMEGFIPRVNERAIDVPDGASASSTYSPRNTKGKSASNEQHDKDSLNETGSTTGGPVEGAPSGSRAERTSENEAQARRSPSPPPKSLVSRILARSRTPDDPLDHSEPFSQLWVVLSNVYGELIVILTMALCLAEVMDTPVPLLSLQGIFLMYMYVGSIAVIIGIYIWVLVDSCSNMGRGGLEDAELGRTSLTRFGSLKRAHISRSRTAPTSFYIRVGALLFGLATLVFNGLEMAMHSMMQGSECLSDVIFIHPILHGLFTFLQMHFLFVNSQVLVEKFGLAARFGFIHLAATNIAVWARLVIWDSAQEWTYFVHLAQQGPLSDATPLHLRGFPGSLTKHARDILDQATFDSQRFVRPYEPISQEQISQVVALQECLNTNTLGQLWTSSMPFLYPFIVQFSLIAAAVTFVMGQNVGRSRFSLKHKFHSIKDLPNNGARIGCDGSSKGLFMGILCMVAGIVVILIFLVVREDENFSTATLAWVTCGTLIAILALSGVMTASGLVQIRQMSVVTRAPAALDSLLSNVALFGVQLYSVFTIVVSACSIVTMQDANTDAEQDKLNDMIGRHILLLAASALQLVQCYAQSTLIAEAAKRSCITRFQMLAKPGRQIVTFLLFSNAVLWAFDTVITQNWVSQELQLRFFGVLAWGIVSRIGLPLLIFYRFHSCVLLLEAWNKCYRTPKGEYPLN